MARRLSRAVPPRTQPITLGARPARNGTGIVGSWLQLRHFGCIGFDLLALQPELAELVLREQLELVAAVLRAALPRVAVAHEAVGLHGGRELDHADPCFAVLGITFACRVQRAPGDDAERAEAADMAVAGQIDVGKLEA